MSTEQKPIGPLDRNQRALMRALVVRAAAAAYPTMSRPAMARRLGLSRVVVDRALNDEIKLASVQTVGPVAYAQQLIELAAAVGALRSPIAYSPKHRPQAVSFSRWMHSRPGELVRVAPEKRAEMLRLRREGKSLRIIGQMTGGYSANTVLWHLRKAAA